MLASDLGSDARDLERLGVVRPDSKVNHTALARIQFQRISI